MAAFTFNPIDYSGAFSGMQNRANNIQTGLTNAFNGLQQFGNSLNSFGEDKERWAQMKAQQAEQARRNRIEDQERAYQAQERAYQQQQRVQDANRKNQFFQNLNGVQNKFANAGSNFDEQIAGYQQQISDFQKQLEELQNTKASKEADDWSGDGEVEGSVGEGGEDTYDAISGETGQQPNGDIDAVNYQIAEAQKEIERLNSEKQENPWVKYANHPMLKMAIADAANTGSMQPVLNFMTAMMAEDKDARNWENAMDQQAWTRNFQERSLAQQNAQEQVSKESELKQKVLQDESNKRNQLAARYDMRTLDRNAYGKLKRDKNLLRRRKAELEAAYDWAVENNDEKLMQNVISVLHQYNNLVYPAPSRDLF